MHILGFNITRRSAPAPEPETPLSEVSVAWLRGDDVNTSAGVLSNAYEQSVWVYRAINVLAEQVANIPFLFSRGERGRENLITSGPLLDFYDHPGLQLNRFQYWELRIMWLMLRGECFRVPIYEESSSASSSSSASRITNHASRRLSRIIFLDPSHVHHIIEDHKLIGWRYSGSGREAPLESQVFLPEEVWF